MKRSTRYKHPLADDDVFGVAANHWSYNYIKRYIRIVYGRERTKAKYSILDKRTLLEQYIQAHNHFKTKMTIRRLKHI